MLLSSGNLVLGIVVGIIVFFLLLLAICIKIVPQAQAYVVEKLGSYHKTLTSGVHWVWPIIFRVAQKISLKEQVKDYEPQPVITMDNVTMQIDTVVFYEITDPKLYTYGVENPIYALEKLTATTLRNIIGSIELDQTLTSRDLINTRMTEILDVATDPWGIKVTRVELKNILPPKDIREAMEKQMRAERERREKILQAEGEKKSAILIAEGEKESVVLRAEAKKAALIAEAEGVSKSIQLINDSNPGQAYLALKGYEALEKVADGQATKLIIPSELASLTSVVSAAVETVNSTKEKK